MSETTQENIAAETPAAPRSLAEQMQAETSLKSKVATLRTARQAWEAGEVAASNRRKYEILAETYRLLTSSTPEELREVATLFDISMNAATPAASIAVKIVFGDTDRRRASSLGKVLEAAQAKKKTPEDLVQWIKDEGGVENIRLQKPKSSDKKPAEIGKAKVRKQLKPVFVIPAAQAADMKDGADGFLVHISRRNPNSGHDVLFTLNTDAVLNAVFAAIAKASEGEDAGAETAGNKSKTRSIEVNGVTATGLKAAMEDAVQA
ncbi:MULTISPECIES: hypothetical protein [unclassified Rhizobium]|uniref:hypothetical protein n=1 Tax=unclassified Rhizobium TaxID=2613769 RepID=UPI000BC41E17|nr:MULTISPECIES: hypothetical protein [unclassified Rhizobium]MDH7804910.1 hypothetical protein [Rhizobium sp. AN67]MDQ4406530.1 hypothetical protein [Rhizobium sp. AN63]SOD56248.1 hypothetical protein SAMN05216595_2976 [Rhizobium sp. AN6A]